MQPAGYRAGAAGRVAGARGEPGVRNGRACWPGPRWWSAAVA